MIKLIRVHPWPAKPASVFIRVCCLAISALASACASPAPPADNFYRLDSAPQVQPLSRPVLPGVLEVNRLDVDGVLNERGLAYQEKDGALARYRYDLWSDAPATLLQLALADALRSAHAADQVVTPDLRVPPDWALRGRLFRFEYLPAQSKVAVRLQLAVVSARDGALVLMKTYAEDLPVAAPGPEAAVAALSRATSDLFTGFVADLSQAQIPQQRR